MDKKEPSFNAAQERAQSSSPARLQDPIRRDRLGRFAKKKNIAIAVGCVVLLGAIVGVALSFARPEARDEITIAPAAPSAAPADASGEIAPSFDIVRMEKGEVVVSGRAAPRAQVHVLDNGVELGTETADENGQWVFLPKKALPVGDRRLTLYTVGKDGARIRSRQSALLRVSENKEEEVGAVVGGKKDSRIIKAPKGDDIGSLRLEKIDYSEDGGFKASGRGDKGLGIRLYIGRDLFAEASVDDGGNWTVDKDIRLENERLYKIRVDMVRGKKVVRRVQYRFAPHFLDSSEASAFMVRKGDSLWTLALKEYGRGAVYVVIFE
ncbi:MAG: hypothetical protein LBH41_00090 [Rickettsiales bacterium]|jgi:nucleoid-associated protein YgaU|nr:hypothetical protein [Rickettsiales bacterium]